jgi:hypothetical protein
MRIYCRECGEKSRIASSKRITENITDLYCQCSNAEHCGHTFVARLAFEHTLNPSRAKMDRIILERLRALPAHQQLDLLQQAKAG